MKYTYPIIIKHEPSENGVDYFVELPDFDYMTQGETISEAITMGQDLLANAVIIFEDQGKELPTPSDIKELQKQNPDDIISLVVADSVEYRKTYNSDSIKKTLTLPTWLNTLSEQKNINFSQTLQEALKEKLNVG